MYGREADYPDCKLIMAVAQETFEVSGNRFANLVPIIWADGTLLDKSDFPGNGLVWWKVPEGYQKAHPGRLATKIFQVSALLGSLDKVEELKFLKEIDLQQGFSTQDTQLLVQQYTIMAGI